MRTLLLMLGTALVLAASVGRADALSLQFVPAYPLYYQGPFATDTPSGGETTTAFIWAPTDAGAANPHRSSVSEPIAPGGEVRHSPAAAT